MIGASILACDLANIGNECKSVINKKIDFLHLDIMDGHFVPNITFGPPVIKCLRKHLGPEIIFDVHLMVTNPEKWIDDIIQAGANIFTFHIESVDEKTTKYIIQTCNEKNIKIGIALKPNTHICVIEPYISNLYLVLIMSVEPGFGGQKCIPEMFDKIKELRQKYPDINIEVDGGINETNIEDVIKAGANMIVAGSSIFQSNNKNMIQKYKNIIDRYKNNLLM